MHSKTFNLKIIKSREYVEKPVALIMSGRIKLTTLGLS